MQKLPTIDKAPTPFLHHFEIRGDWSVNIFRRQEDSTQVSEKHESQKLRYRILTFFKKRSYLWKLLKQTVFVKSASIFISSWRIPNTKLSFMNVIGKKVLDIDFYNFLPRDIAYKSLYMSVVFIVQQMWDGTCIKTKYFVGSRSITGSTTRSIVIRNRQFTQRHNIRNCAYRMMSWEHIFQLEKYNFSI